MLLGRGGTLLLSAPDSEGIRRNDEGPTTVLGRSTGRRYRSFLNTQEEGFVALAPLSQAEAVPQRLADGSLQVVAGMLLKPLPLQPYPKRYIWRL
jgi:hypothetical protein